MANRRYTRSSTQKPYALKAAREWGEFVRYIEFGGDNFALRQVDEFANGFLVRFDRVHWDDQFGTLADFRLGKRWVEHWGEPDYIDEELFEAKWRAAEESYPFALRRSAFDGPPPWIALFESGRWKGQE
jgi:hypothetical protein